MSFSNYDEYDAMGLAQLVTKGDITATELLDEAITRRDKVNPHINAIIDTYDDQARAWAADSPSGAFAGVPFLLKDLHLSMAGTVNSNGSAMWQGDVASHDDTLVARYKNAGLVIFGRTNSPELGLNPVTEPKAYGASRNPWDVTRTPGGSSGGAAAAVAAGITPVAHASDGGGSIRIPASCCGLVGLKPSRGRIPFGPNKSEGWAGLSTSHIVSRTVRDSAAMLDATAGPEPGDAYAAPHYPGSFLAAAQSQPEKLRVAISREKWGQGSLSQEVIAGLDAVATVLQGLGHIVEEARPHFEADEVSAANYTIVGANIALMIQERAAQLHCAPEDLDMEEGTRFILELGKTGSSVDYAHAIHVNQALGRTLGRFHEHYDVLLAPTLASPPVPIGHITEAPEEEYTDRLFNFFGNTNVYNQTGQPSISLPLHWTASGLPVGIMFTGAYGNDALLLQLAGQLEDAMPWRDRRPPLHASTM